MTLHYKRAGNGQPVILLHGLFGALDNLGRLARHLSAQFEVISIDLPNHGLSPHSDNVSYEHMASQVSDLLAQLGLKNVAILGHSMGGKVAMQLAIAQPDLINTLLVADIAPVRYTNRHDKVFAALNAIRLDQLSNRKEALDILIAADIDHGTAQFLLKNLVKHDDAFQWRFNLSALEHGYPNIINGLSVSGSFDKPTLFIKGQLSDYITADHREQINQYFPQVSAKIIQGTGHWLHAEKPDIFGKIVTDFLAKNS